MIMEGEVMSLGYTHLIEIASAAGKIDGQHSKQAERSPPRIRLQGQCRVLAAQSHRAPSGVQSRACCECCKQDRPVASVPLTS